VSERPDAQHTDTGTSIEDAPGAVRFADRHDAGRRLAARLERFRRERPIVVGMARGGVPVAAEVARALAAPLDVAVVRKVGAPHNPEFAIGAVAEGGVHVLSRHAVDAVGLSDRAIQALLWKAEREVAVRLRRYRGEGPSVVLRGRTVIVVDDGLATGRSAQAAIASVRRRRAGRVVLAVPVAAPEPARGVCAVADEVVCVQMPTDMWAVGVWYEDFSPIADSEVAALLAASPYRDTSPSGDASPSGDDASSEMDAEMDAGT
jgi:putative phosphoribosyl transferase